MPTIESLLTIPQAAKLTGVSVRTFYSLLAREAAPEIVRVGRSVRVRASDMDLWLKLGCCSRAELERAKRERERGE